MGCYDSLSFSFPLEYISFSDEKLKEVVKSDLDKRIESDKLKKEENRLKEEENKAKKEFEDYQRLKMQFYKLSEYQLEILKQLRDRFPNFQIEIGRGDRLMVNGNIITGFLVGGLRSENHKDYLNDVAFFSQEIEKQYLNKLY